MPLVEHATAATMGVDTMVGTEATTGMSGIGATLVTVLTGTATVTAGDSGLASAGGGHTGILMATVTAPGGMVPTITRIITPPMRLTATHTLTTAKTLPHQVLAPSPAITPR
jgi:hypothetical protein